jgi:hypothetical protein
MKKYESVEALKNDINFYFKECERRKRPLTITGLAISLGFTSREALLNYEKTEGYEKFFDTVKKAKLIVQNFAEEFLYSGKNVAGAIFNLKCNYGWEDKQTIEHIGRADAPVNVILQPLKTDGNDKQD